MRALIIGALGIITCLAEVYGVPKHTVRLVFNRTQSAPIGLYWVMDSPLSKGDWAILSSKSKASKWAQNHGYLGRDWPMIKRVMAFHGDEVCRDGSDVFINEKYVATAQSLDALGRNLPIWSGCYVLGADDVFLLNVHPHSLDGRYFGVMSSIDIDGGAKLIWLIQKAKPDNLQQ